MDLTTVRTKREIQLAELEEWREMAYQSKSYIKKEPKDAMTSESRSSNSSWEIRHFSLTLVFIYSVMVSFIVSRKAFT
jgi:hypothetical protein